MRRSLALSMSGETHSIVSYPKAVGVRSRGLLRRFMGLILGVTSIGHMANAGELTLSWNDNSNNEDGFRIERSSDGSSFVEIATVGTNVATYQDKTIVEDQNYTYRVRAFNEFGDSGYSNSASGSVGSSGNNEAETIVTGFSGLERGGYEPGQVDDFQVSSAEAETIIIGFSGLKGGVYEPGETDDFQVLVIGTQSAIQSVQYFDDDNLVATENAAPYDFSFSSTVEGSHTLRAVVTTGLGQYEETVVVSVERISTEAETMAISFVGLLGGTYEPGQVDDFQVSVIGTQSTIQSVQYFDNDNLVATENASPYGFTFSPLSEGTHALKAVVTTDFGVYEESVFTTVEIPVNLAPSISELTNLSLPEGVTTVLVEFTIGDADTSLSELIVLASSSNTALIRESGIVLSGSGSNRSAKLTATEGRSGTATITISISDGANTIIETFELEVSEVSAPTISALDDISTPLGEAIAPIAFSVQDNETPASDLSIAVESSNTLLLPNVNIAAGGSGSNRNLLIVPVTGELGVATVTVTVSDGVSETVETLDVAVQTAPVIVSQPANTEAIVGDITALDIDVSAYPAANIQWLRNGQPIEGANSAELLFTQVSLDDAGAYSVVLFNELGRVFSNVVQLTVESLISIVESPVDVLIEQEGTATLSVAANGPGLTYQWYRGVSGDRSNPIEGATGPSYTTDTLTEDTQYWVEIKTGGIAQGLETVESTTIEVNIAPSRRFYFGSVSRDGGTFALMVREDKSAVFLSDFGSEPMEIVDLQISESGSFQYADENGLIVIEGTADLDRVSGFFTDSAYSFTGESANGRGATTDLNGLYTAVLPNTSDGQVLVIAGPDGQAFVSVGLGATGASGEASIDSQGVLTADLNGEYAFALKLDDSVKGLNGSLLIGSENYAVDGQREDVAARRLLVNTSIRGQVGAGSSTMIAGFVVSGGGTKKVLIRGLGPELANRGVFNVIGDPQLSLYRMGENDPFATNDNWQEAANASEISISSQQVGASALSAGSLDSAMVLELPQGIYTAVLKNAAGADGTALVEVFDVSEATGDTRAATLANISMRGEVAWGSQVIVAGFTVTGDAPKRMLIRAMGSELEAHGVSNALANPLLSIYQATSTGSTFIAENDDWQEEGSVVTDAASRSGAFDFDQNSQSSAKVIWLDPGVYTTVVQSANSTRGVALVEVYEVD